MWGRRRIRQLEVNVAEAWAGQQELRRRLEIFEQIAAAAGSELPEEQWWQATVPAQPPPTALLAAARDQAPRASAVRLDAAGTDVIAIIGGPGDPEQWWSAVWKVAERAGDVG
jgi:hypothetical protein